MSESRKPDVLLLKPILADTMRILAERFVLHRLDRAPDADALLAAVAPSVRADPPPPKWSALRYGFEPNEDGSDDEEEAQAG